MARRTTGFTLYVVILDELAAQGAMPRRRLPVHAEHLGARPNKTLRPAVAVQTPFHQQRLILPGERHSIDASMTGNAADPLFHVDAVIEIDEVRQIVNALPLEGLAGAVALAYRCEHGAADPDL